MSETSFQIKVMESEDEPILKKLKKEMQCPVCDQIPTSIPIPACHKGHIVCMECKDKSPDIRMYSSASRRDTFCPICLDPMDDNISYIAGTVLSLMKDIPCSFKNSGCTFEGSLEDHKAHGDVCMFKMVFCFVCEEECTRKDFPSHNNKVCFLKTPSNTFRFPDRSSLYLVQVNPEEEILVEACYVNNARIRMDEEGIDYVGFNIYLLENSSSLARSSKMKIVMTSPPDDPSFQIEATSAITAGPYMVKKMWDTDLVLAARSKDTELSFQIID